MEIVPREYARSGRGWHGSLPLDSFKRLANELNEIDIAIRVQLEFSLDDNDVTRMQGDVDVEAEFPCHRCLLHVPYHLKAVIDVRIVTTEARASQIAGEFDVMICADGPVQIQDLIEDDLLLNVPWNVCPDEKTCVHRPAMLYGSSDAKRDTRHRPFAVLKNLISD